MLVVGSVDLRMDGEVMGIFTKGINRGAYRGRLICPVCRSEAIRFLENITQFRLRYRCRKCGLPFQYDITQADPGTIRRTHPYAPFNKPKWRAIVERFERGRTK